MNPKEFVHYTAYSVQPPYLADLSLEKIIFLFAILYLFIGYVDTDRIGCTMYLCLVSFTGQQIEWPSTR